MVGLVPHAANFFIFLAAFTMFQLTSETIGEICAAVSGSATYAVLVRAVGREVGDSGRLAGRQAGGNAAWYACLTGACLVASRAVWRSAAR